MRVIFLSRDGKPCQECHDRKSCHVIEFGHTAVYRGMRIWLCQPCFSALVHALDRHVEVSA